MDLGLNSLPSVLHLHCCHYHVWLLVGSMGVMIHLRMDTRRMELYLELAMLRGHSFHTQDKNRI